MKRVDIVFNPNAGRGRAATLAARVAELVRDAGMSPRTFTIGEFLAADGAIALGCDCVVSLGGDGTVRALVEGLGERFANAAPPIAVLAMGTANLIARHLALPWSERAGLDAMTHAIAAGATRSMDVPIANGKPFLLMCSVGFDAQVVHEVAARRRGPISMLHYLPALARSVVDFRPDELSVVADGKPIFGPGPAMVIVASAPEYGTGFSLNPAATSNDGVLDVTIFDVSQRKDLVATAFHAVTSQVADGAAIVTTAREVDITGTRAPAQIDGEAFGHVPIHIGLLPYRQNFIVPA